MKNKQVLLGHGSGGSLSHDLISKLFVRHFDNPILKQQTDSALLNISSKHIAYTTDSYVVDPIFFPGGNIGKLAIAGTVNDLAVSGATPKYISCGFIIEEGFALDELETIVKTMAEEAQKAGVLIVTGDTKVVDRGKCDKVFINTSGIGVIDENQLEISSGKNIKIGDQIIINGSIGDHGMAILSARNELNIRAAIESDCACLNKMIGEVIKSGAQIKFMRDATRGGVATVLTELAIGSPYGIELDEVKLVVKETVRGMCEILGFDPLYVANEGKVIMIVAAEDSNKVMQILKSNEFGMEASIIGEIVDKHHGKGWVTTSIGGKRIIDMLAGEQLPRIC
ncbi:MAG: hydrogenase expression/formation protein HypE [Bacteroidetes bacterium HGW-Bacteroidetes-17]|nr:MAG: hydrogenase expression/formation protein HypE [Bacteroidetes bacterium HGW-Bacteroidetes-17]